MSFAKNRGFYQFIAGNFLFLHCVSSHTLLLFCLMTKFLLAALLAISSLHSGHAQPVMDDLPHVTSCLALMHAQVVKSPGQSPVVADVIIRNGLIQQVGPDLKIPPDAYRIAADSLYVYPAFIDAFSDTGIHDPEGENDNRQGSPNRNEDRPKPDAEGNLPLEDAGITPFHSVRSSFDPADKSITEWRAQGFAIAHIVPKGKMIPGKGAIIVLAGTLADQMLWKEDVSMYAQWSGAGGSYPSTVIGIMAKWRELYHNASQAIAHQDSYDHVALVSRPNYNQAHEALIPVVRKEMPVYFRSPRVRDISRSLELSKDLGMNLVLADAEEAWYYTDVLKTSHVPLVLSLDLPTDKAEKEKGTQGKEAPDKPLPPVDTEKEAFEKRRAESLKAHLDQAGALSNAGIPFSLGTMSCKSGDFMKNIRTLIGHGLSEDKALEALTTTPAALLHIEKHCGTVEAGKMANIIVSTKPIFEAESAIRYMIVEGQLYAYDIKEKKKTVHNDASPGSSGLLEGKWTYTIDIPDDPHNGFFEFTKDGDVLTGVITSDEITSGNNELEDIVIDKGSVSFIFDFDAGGSMISLEFDLTVDGESYSGTVTIPGAGTFDISGNRISKPNE